MTAASRLSLCCIISAFILFFAFSYGLTAEAQQAKVSQKEVDVLYEEIVTELDKNILSLWYPACIDKQNGGYYQYFDNQWQRILTEKKKGIVGQSRLLWVASQAAMLFPDNTEFRNYADHGFYYLNGEAWDNSNGGWFWYTCDVGNKEKAATQKHVYGISFGIYACAAYYKLTKNTKALNLAREAFELLEKYAHDNQYGGYHESFTSDWKPRLQDENYSMFCPVGVWPGVKTMNTHIHLLEAFCELYSVWPDTHQKMFSFWMEVWEQNRDVLLYGVFRAEKPEGSYPIISANSEGSTIIGVYSQNTVVELDQEKGHMVVLFNAIAIDVLYVNLVTQPTICEIFNCIGEKQNHSLPEMGLRKIHVPRSGLLKLTF